MIHPAAGMARTEPIAAIINDLPKTAGEDGGAPERQESSKPGCDDQSVDQKD